MEKKPKPPKGKHDYWKTLIDLLETKGKIAEVHLILIKPIKPPQPVPGHPDEKYNYKAYVHGKGSEYYGTFKHRESCHWDPEPGS